MANFKEEWKVVEGYPRYEISNKGAIYSKITHKELKPIEYGSGKAVQFGGSTRRYRIDVLVASHFLSDKGETHIVVHKDGDYFNNNVTNLRWCTKEEYQSEWKKQNTRKSRPKKIDVHKLNELLAMRIDGATLDELAFAFKISASYANALCRKHLVKHHARTIDKRRVVKWWYADDTDKYGNPQPPEKWEDGSVPVRHRAT